MQIWPPNVIVKLWAEIDAPRWTYEWVALVLSNIFTLRDPLKTWQWETIRYTSSRHLENSRSATSLSAYFNGKRHVFRAYNDSASTVT